MDVGRYLLPFWERGETEQPLPALVLHYRGCVPFDQWVIDYNREVQ